FLASEAAGPLQRLGQFAAAERLYRRSVEQTALDNSNYPAFINNLAELLQDTNRLDEAEPLYRRALALWEKSLGPDHPDVATTLVRPRPGRGAGRPNAAGRPRRAVPASAPARRPADRSRPPQRRHPPQQPGGVAAGHQPAGRGRAAVPPGAGDLGEGARPGPS